MKEKYSKPVLEIIAFDSADVIITSDTIGEGDENDD